MRFFTYVLCALACCCACDTLHAQIFRGFRSRVVTSGSCANGSCAVPAFVQPARVVVDPFANGVIDQGGAKVEHAPPKKADVLPAPKEVVKPLIEADAPNEVGPDLFGVEWDKIRDGSIDASGKTISLAESMQYANGTHDYAKNLCRLVVIGTAEQCKPVREAFAKMSNAEREAVSPWFVSKDHWSLRDQDGGGVIFETGGNPTVYLLAPDGAVIHRQDGWTGEADIDAIRKGLKKYDPKKDVDLRKVPALHRRPLQSFLGKIDRITLLGCVAALGGLFVFAMKGKS